MREDEPLHGREAEADPGLRRCPPIADVRLEDAVAQLGRDARTAVLHLELHGRSPRAYAQYDDPVGRVAQVLEGVSQQVAQHHDQYAGAARDGALRRYLHAQLRGGFLGLRTQLLDQTGNDPADVGRRPRLGSRSRPGELQQGVDDPAHSLQAGCAAAHGRLQPGGAGGLRDGKREAYGR